MIDFCPHCCFLQAHNITHVLNVTSTCPKPDDVPDDKFFRIAVNDGYIDKLLPHMDKACAYIGESPPTCELLRTDNFVSIFYKCMYSISILTSPTLFIYPTNFFSAIKFTSSSTLRYT